MADQTNEAIGMRVRSLLAGHSMTQADLAPRVGMDQSALSRSLAGQRTFKPLEIARIAEQFSVTSSSLIEGANDEPSVAIAARRSAHNSEAVSAAMERASFFRQLAALADGEHRVRRFRGALPSGQTFSDGEAFAARVLSQSGLGKDPLPTDMHDFAGLIEKDLRVQVSLEPLGHGLDGLSYCCDHFGLAMVSTSIAPARQRWTLAHEVAHVLLRDAQDDILVDENVYARTGLETRANAFAAAFLMPPSLLTEAWGDAARITESRVARMLDVFGVSLDALAFRLHNVGLVGARGRDAIRRMRPMMSLLRNQASRQSEAMWLPTGITHDAAAAYARGDIGIRWLAALLDLDASELLDRLQPDEDEVRALVVDGDTIYV